MLERWKGLSNTVVQNSKDEYTICSGVEATTSATKVVSKSECTSIYNFLRVRLLRCFAVRRLPCAHSFIPPPHPTPLLRHQDVMQANQCCGFTDRTNVVQNPAHLNCTALVTSSTTATCASYVLDDNKWLVRSMSITLATLSVAQFLCLLVSSVFMCRVKRYVNDGLTIGSRETIKL